LSGSLCLSSISYWLYSDNVPKPKVIDYDHLPTPRATIKALPTPRRPPSPLRFITYEYGKMVRSTIEVLRSSLWQLLPSPGNRALEKTFHAKMSGVRPPRSRVPPALLPGRPRGAAWPG